MQDVNNAFKIQQFNKNQKQQTYRSNQELNQTINQFHSSKNQFLSTIFQTQLSKHKHQQLSNLNHQINIDNNQIYVINDQNTLINNQIDPIDNEKQNKNKLSIKIQYSQFYDPLNNKQFHIKSNKYNHKQNRLKQRLAQSTKLSKYKQKQQLKQQFVQIYQQRNIQQQNEYKIYQQELRKKSIIPGPGAYNISKPLVQPIYETIQKNENIVLVKLHNNVQGTSNFRSGNQKLNSIYDKQKLQNPGPGDYATTIDQIKNKKRQRNKSKLQQYSKNYQSNYKFIFQVFNSQIHSHQSIPNYSITDSSNGTQYNGKPQKLQQLCLQIKKHNLLKQQKSRKKLLQNAKSPNLLNQFQRQRSISQLQSPKLQQKSHKIFEFKTVDQQKIKQKQSRMRIQSQINQKFTNSILIIPQQLKNNQINNIQIKKKIQKLIFNRQINVNNKKQLYNRKQHFYRDIGYFDGTQKDKLNSKYNVKFQKHNQTLKKILQPLSTPNRKFQSLDISQSTNHKINKYKQIKPQYRYNANMLDILVHNQPKKQYSKLNLPNSRLSFMNQLGLQKSYLNSTIQYE